MFATLRLRAATAIVLVGTLTPLQPSASGVVGAFGAVASGSPGTHVHAPRLTFIDQPSPVQRETISWAVGRFVAVGLQLPDLDIRFPVSCNGKGAVYHVGQSSIDFCRVNRKNVLHELAHAWDDSSGAIDREEFMKLRGVTLWFGGLDVPAIDQGSEHLAIIIAWGLMDPDARSAHGLPNNSDRELTDAFELLTQSSPAANLEAQPASPPIAPEAPSVRQPSIAGTNAITPASGGEVVPEVDLVARLAASQPHVLGGPVADVIVRLHGELCSGTPITGTVYVVTAAHCVLTDTGEVTQRTIGRDRVSYPAVGVLVDTAYFDHPSEELDVAVLIMAEVIPGPSARVGSALPDSGQVALAGFQQIDSDGTLLRGHRLNDHPLPQVATGTPIDSPFRPAGCVESVQSLELSAARVMVPCGLVPGASGGGLFAEDNGELVLVGILSTVTADLSANGIVPLASLHELLKHPDRYAHGFATGHTRYQSRSPDVIRHGELRNLPSLKPSVPVTTQQQACSTSSPVSTRAVPSPTPIDRQDLPRTREIASSALVIPPALGLLLPPCDHPTVTVGPKQATTRRHHENEDTNAGRRDRRTGRDRRHRSDRDDHISRTSAGPRRPRQRTRHGRAQCRRRRAPR